MIRDPGRPPARDERRTVGLLDVPPTLLPLLGIHPPAASWQGRDLFGSPARTFIVTERLSEVAIGGAGRWKAVGRRGSTAGWKYFDLARDPGEREPREVNPKAVPLARRYAEWSQHVRRAPRDRKSTPVGMCRDLSDAKRERMQEQLRALGYAR
jgi:arylsulfatase A-like enzyme